MIDYYISHYKEYHEKTFNIDSSSFLKGFMGLLPPAAHVLDIGCGSGRDLLLLKHKGFHPTGFEHSPGLASLARQKTGCTVIEGDFEYFDFSSLSMDAILASGSLVHLPHERVFGVLKNILRALKPPFVFPASKNSPARVYISCKEGTGNHKDIYGRTFYLWQDQAFREIILKLGLSVQSFSRNESSLGSGEIWLGYVLAENVEKI